MEYTRYRSLFFAFFIASIARVDSWLISTTNVILQPFRTNIARNPLHVQQRASRLLFSSTDPSIVSEDEYNSNGNEDDEQEDEQDDFWGLDELELLEGTGVDFDDEDTDEDWIPDSVKAQKKRKFKVLRPASEVIKDPPKVEETKTTDPIKNRPSPYTEEEEELIEALGGKYAASGRREEGFLGDCTLEEIATDYSVPICYLADVLCMWGVPVPINVHDRLGDLATGEQAFALVEAVNSLDIGVLQDRYSNMDFMQLCGEFEIDVKEAFEFAMKEGWSLPFGVRTNLRVEQEEELLRLYSPVWRKVG